MNRKNGLPHDVLKASLNKHLPTILLLIEIFLTIFFQAILSKINSLNPVDKQEEESDGSAQKKKKAAR